MRMHPLEVFSSNSAFLSRRQKQNQTVKTDPILLIFSPRYKEGKETARYRKKKVIMRKKNKEQKKMPDREFLFLHPSPDSFYP